mmetsp:Transcript_67229/g.161104  ORF Transcript_67229/g.161104 Transcript_67229/m.161104 type:complete len:99 (+) Transcript_67229:295-591(+)
MFFLGFFGWPPMSKSRMAVRLSSLPAPGETMPFTSTDSEEVNLPPAEGTKVSVHHFAAKVMAATATNNGSSLPRRIGAMADDTQLPLIYLTRTDCRTR